METEETILEQFEKSTEQENDVKQEQVEQVSQDVEEHAPEIEVHETNAESSYEEAEDKEPVEEPKEEEETTEQVEETKEEVVETKEEESTETQEPKEEVEKSTKDSKEEDEDEEEDSKDSKDDEEDDEEDKAKKSESDMFEAIKSIINSSMARIDERITQLEDTVTKGLVTETVESEPVEQEVEPKVEAKPIKEEEPVEEVTDAEPEAVIEAEEVEESKEEETKEEEPAEVEEEEELTSKSVKVATQNRENDDEQAIKSVIQDDEDAVGYASKDASRIQETLEEEPNEEEETAKSFDGVAQTTEVKENPQEFMTENRQAFLDELSKAYHSSGFSNGYREELRRAFLDINNGTQSKQQFELVKSFLNK